MVWRCHRCEQVNKDSYRRCMQCETRKYICPNCGTVDYNVEDGRRATVWERIKYVLGYE